MGPYILYGNSEFDGGYIEEPEFRRAVFRIQYSISTSTPFFFFNTERSNDDMNEQDSFDLNVTDFSISFTFKDLPTWLIIILSIIKILVMSFIIIAAIFGNLLVIVSVMRHRKLRVITNYFVVSLAFADMLVAIVVMTFNFSVQVTGKWIFGYFMCDVWNSFDVYFSTASILHLCCISVDRYYAIVKPLRYPISMTKRVVWIMLASTWLSPAMISFVPIFLGWYTTERHQIHRDKNPYECDFKVNKLFAVISSSISFWIPCAIMIFTYLAIFREANRQEKQIHRRQGNAILLNHRRSRDLNGDFGSSSGGSSKAPAPDASVYMGPDTSVYMGPDTSVYMGPDTSKAPAPDTSVYMGPDTSKAPAPDTSVYMGPDTSVYLGPDTSKAPVSVITKAPAPDTSIYMGPDTSKASVPVITKAPAPDTSIYIGPDTSKAPVPVITKAPAPDTSIYIGPDTSKAPVPVITKAPTIRTFKAPVPKPFRAPVPDISEAPAPNTSKASTSNAPAPDNSITPAVRTTPTKDRNIIKMKREHKAARTLGIIMGTFILCWLPFFLWYVASTLSDSDTPPIVVAFLFWVGYFNSTLNPLIYAYFNRDFREAFKNTLQCAFCSLCRRAPSDLDALDAKRTSLRYEDRARSTFSERVMSYVDRRRSSELTSNV